MRFLIMAAAAIAFASPAAAALVVDQDSFITPLGSSLTGSSLTSFAPGAAPMSGRTRQQVQSLTVGVGGQFTRVDFQLYRNAMTSTLLEVTVARGTFGTANYAPLGQFSQTVTATMADILGGGFTSVDVSGLGLMVAPGEVLSFLLSTGVPQSGGSQLFWVIGEPGANPGEVINAPVLANGFAQVTIDAGANWLTVPTDRALRTHVETATSAVPEPQSWALLIAGFGLVGTMGRRQRRLAA
jgi:PEP-CTERM motif